MFREKYVLSHWYIHVKWVTFAQLWQLYFVIESASSTHVLCKHFLSTDKAMHKDFLFSYRWLSTLLDYTTLRSLSPSTTIHNQKKEPKYKTQVANSFFTQPQITIIFESWLQINYTTCRLSKRWEQCKRQRQWWACSSSSASTSSSLSAL